MVSTSRLNVLLTHPEPRVQYTYGPVEWHELVSRMLQPMHVRTFLATSGHEALDLIEHHAMHVAVLDTRLSAGDNGAGMNVMTITRLIQRLRSNPPIKSADSGFRSNTGSESQSNDYSHGQSGQIAGSQDQFSPASYGPSGRRIPVTGPSSDSRESLELQQQAKAPLVILLAPPGSAQLMHDALEWNVFSIIPEPLEINRLLEVMARALERFYDNQWPG